MKIPAPALLFLATQTFFSAPHAHAQVRAPQGWELPPLLEMIATSCVATDREIRSQFEIEREWLLADEKSRSERHASPPRPLQLGSEKLFGAMDDIPPLLQMFVSLSSTFDPSEGVHAEQSLQKLRDSSSALRDIYRKGCDARTLRTAITGYSRSISTFMRWTHKDPYLRALHGYLATLVDGAQAVLPREALALKRMGLVPP